MTEDAVPLGVTLGSIFDERAEQYDAWFDEHAAAYWSELGALRKASREGIGLEAGVGTGRFTGSMGVGFGIDPSPSVLSIARRSGVKVVMGVAEGLPFRDRTFDIVTFVKTLCFVDDPLMALVEARRVLREHGRVIIGFIDRGSRIGHGYQGG